jgi:hypothetical protein
MKPHVYVDPGKDPKLDDEFDNTFNDRSETKHELPSITSHKQNFDVVERWGSTLNNLKEGEGHKDGVRETEYPLKPLPFDKLH